MKINVGRINSVKTHIPFNLHAAFFCKDRVKKKPVEDNIGEILMGDRIYPTDYQVFLMNDSYCSVLCEFNFDLYHASFIQFLIENNYRATYYLDGLPAVYVNLDDGTVDYDGIPLGKKVGDEFIIYNHLTFHIELQKEESALGKLIGDSLSSTGENLGFLSNDNDYNVKSLDDLKKMKFSVRKFQITPFSIKHRDLGNGLIETNCYKRKDEKENKTENSEISESKSELNENINNQTKQEHPNNTTNYNNTNNEKSSKTVKNELTIEKQIEFQIYNKQYKNTTNLIDAENYFPKINSNQSIEKFKESVLFNYLNKQHNSLNYTEKSYFTYDIKFSVSKKEAKLVSRWDYYLKQDTNKESIHWIGLILSSAMILVFSIILFIIFYKLIKKDIDYIQLVRMFFY